MSPTARLAESVSGVERHLRRRAALAIVPWVTAGVALFLVTAWAVAGDAGWRPGSNVPFVLDALIVAWVAAGVVVFRRGARRWFGEVPLSRSIEGAVGLKPGMVRGSLELSRGAPGGTSSALVSKAVTATATDLGGRAPEDLAGDLGFRVALWARRGLIAATVSVVALATLGVASPERTARAWAGVSSPFRTMADPVLAPIVVRPGDVEVPRGTDVRIDVDAAGRQSIELTWQSAGDVAHTLTLPVEQGVATHVLESVSATTEYRARGEPGSETATFHITPSDPLFVSDLVVGVRYPPHTGLSPDEYRGDVPPLRLPVGSRLTFDGSTSRPLSRAELVDSAGETALALDVDGAGFEGVWTPGRGGAFDWAFRDRSGAPAEIQPDPLEILLVPDSVPSVAILVPGQDTVLPLSLQQPLVVDSRDDYGLRRVELVAYRVTAFGERQEPVVQGLDLGGTRAALARPILDVSSWGLLPGDTVRYFARVVDNNPAAQTAQTPEYALRMPAASEMRREAGSVLDSLAARLEELQAEAGRQAEENRDQALESTTPRDQSTQRSDRQEPGFEQREELRRALEEQQALLSEIDSLQTQLESLQQAMEEAGQADPELQRNLEELQDLLQQLGSDDLRERMEELAQALQAERQDANESLRNLAEEQQKFGERVEEALDRFRRAAVEQDFRATTQEVQDLARRQDALADALREEDAPELRAEQQSDVAERTADLQEQMERLAERLSAIEEQQAAANVEQAQQATSDARQQMEQAAQRAQQGDSQDAAQQAQQAADQMQQAADQMQQAQNGMADQAVQEAQTALNQAADDALGLARSQSTLRQRMVGGSPDEAAQLRGDQASLLRGMENIAQSLSDGLQDTGGNPEISAQVQRAIESLSRTIESLENSRSSGSQRAAEADQAVGSLNQLAMMAMAGAQQMGQQQGGQETGQSGDPSGAGQSGQDLVKQMGQLAQRQGELLSRTGDLMPMRLGQQAMQQQLSTMAQQQQAVAQDLGSMSGEPGSGDVLGSVEEMAREAEALARQLEQGRLTPDVVREQERLFHRLLDAGRSLEREEFSEKRESEEPGAFERGEVLPLSALQMGVMPYELPDREQLSRLSPAVRQLVLDYFERLNREGPGS